MAGLRDNFGIAVESPELGRYVDEAAAQGMGSLRRGWEAGRIGTETNALSAEELNLRAAGEIDRASLLREQIGGLQQRQATFAPRVGRVEDINGVGDGLSWAAGQVGQGAASMVDPIAASAAISTAGRFLPGVAGKAAQVAGLAVPYMMNQRQLTGEFGNTAYQDPELIARTSPTALRDTANLYGAGASVLDTALPGMIGRQISGASRAGSAAARGATMGALPKAGLGMVGEGATETLQSMGSQATQGYLNPDRDTSGDFMENVNSFAGGMAGAGPFTLAGSLAEAGHNRMGAGVDRVKDAAGTVIDLAKNNETLQAGVDKVKDVAAGARGSIVDILGDENGDVTVGGVASKAKDAVNTYRRNRDDLSVLQGEAPPQGMTPEQAGAWVDKSDAKRTEVVSRNLAGMANDPEAQQHSAAIASAPDQTARDNAVEDAADFLLKRHDDVDTKTAKGSGWGEMIGSAAAAAGGVAGGAAKGVVGLAKDFAKGVVAGAKGKKNMQTGGQTDAYAAWRDRMGFSQQNASADAAVAGETNEVERSRRRALMFGNKIAAAATKNGNQDVVAGMRDVGHQIGEWASLDKAHENLDAPGMRYAMNDVIHHMANALGSDAGPILGEMERVSGPQHAPLFAELKKMLVTSRTPEGREMRRQMREDATNRLVQLLPQQEFDAYSADEGRQESLLKSMERLAAGGYPRQVREQLEQGFGKPRLLAMLNVVNDVAIETSSEGEDGVREGPSAFEQAEAMKKMGTNAGAVYGFSGNLALRSKSGHKDIFEVTKKMTKAEKAEAELAGEEAPVNRPQLFKTTTDADGKVVGTQKFEKSGNNILDVNMQTMRDAVGYKSDEETNGYEVGTISAHDLMNENKVSGGQRLALFRDYLRMDAQKAEGAEKTKLSKMSSDAGRLLGRIMGRKETDTDPSKWTAGEFQAWKQQLGEAMTAGYKGSEEPAGFAELDAFDQDRMLKEAETYFKGHHVVVANSTTDNDEQRLTVDTAIKMRVKGKKREEETRRDADMAARAETLPADAAKAMHTVMSMANILYFPGKGGKADVPIAASDLVYWARSVKDKRGGYAKESPSDEKSHSNAKMDAEYLSDLIDGLSAYATDHAYEKGKSFPNG